MPFIYKGLAHVSNRNTLRPNIKIFSNWEGPSPATFVLVKLTGFRPKSTEASVRNSATVDSKGLVIRLWSIAVPLQAPAVLMKLILVRPSLILVRILVIGVRTMSIAVRFALPPVRLKSNPKNYWYMPCNFRRLSFDLK